MKVMKNPEYDYSLTYENTKTLGTYHELKDKAYNAPVRTARQ